MLGDLTPTRSGRTRPDARQSRGLDAPDAPILQDARRASPRHDPANPSAIIRGLHRAGRTQPVTPSTLESPCEYRPDTKKSPQRAVSLESVRQHESVPASARISRVRLEFGLPIGPQPVTIAPGASVVVGPATLTAIVGPSGSGKSTVLDRIAQQYAAAVCVESVAFPTGGAVIDHVAPWLTLRESIELLTTCCGLGDAHL